MQELSLSLGKLFPKAAQLHISMYFPYLIIVVSRRNVHM